MTFDSNHDKGIRLDSPESCQAELETCSNGLAYLTQEATRVEEALAEVKDQYERVEAIVATSIREGSDAKLTATEVKARITELITAEPFFAQARENLFALEADRESLARRLKTLERRGGFAQTAMGKHTNESKFAGKVNYG